MDGTRSGSRDRGRRDGGDRRNRLGWAEQQRQRDGGAGTQHREFFRSQNERRYEDTCRLLSRDFYRTHALRDRQTCTAVMRVAFAWSGKIDFRIGNVTREANRVVVEAVADTAPGQLVLVREDGALRIVAVQGG